MDQIPRELAGAGTMEVSDFPRAARKVFGQRGLAPAQETEARFRRSGYLALRDVTCVARDGVVHLHGCLPSYYLKQVAQSIASAIDGVLSVSNHIEVIAPAVHSPTGRDRVATRVGEID
jgi:osmotically-inducible protein OsmY